VRVRRPVFSSFQLTHRRLSFLFGFCRNYKNGYVWNDLSENDVIYPSDGVEYVLKGSEIFPGCSSGTNRHHLLFSTTMCVFLVVMQNGLWHASMHETYSTLLHRTTFSISIICKMFALVL
jgi:hypothetical protein